MLPLQKIGFKLRALLWCKQSAAPFVNKMPLSRSCQRSQVSFYSFSLSLSLSPLSLSLSPSLSLPLSLSLPPSPSLSLPPSPSGAGAAAGRCRALLPDVDGGCVPAPLQGAAVRCLWHVPPTTTTTATLWFAIGYHLLNTCKFCYYRSYTTIPSTMSPYQYHDDLW